MKFLPYILFSLGIVFELILLWLFPFTGMGRMITITVVIIVCILTFILMLLAIQFLRSNHMLYVVFSCLLFGLFYLELKIHPTDANPSKPLDRIFEALIGIRNYEQTQFYDLFEAELDRYAGLSRVAAMAKFNDSIPDLGFTVFYYTGSFLEENILVKQRYYVWCKEGVYRSNNELFSVIKTEGDSLLVYQDVFEDMTIQVECIIENNTVSLVKVVNPIENKFRIAVKTASTKPRYPFESVVLRVIKYTR